MNKEPTKIKILDMEYKKDEHVFVMKVINMIEQKNAQFIIRATDFGIPKGTTIDIIEYFCKEMIGKEKNLFIEVEKSTVDKKEKLSDEDIIKMDENIEKYPFREVIDIINKEDEEEDKEEDKEEDDKENKD